MLMMEQAAATMLKTPESIQAKFLVLLLKKYLLSVKEGLRCRKRSIPWVLWHYSRYISFQVCCVVSHYLSQVVLLWC